MNQSVPKLCMGESSHPIDILTLATALTNKSSIVPNQALIDYARELTWRNGILRKGASVGRMPHLPITNQPSASWDRLESSGGTLESLVDQATRMTSLRSNTQSVILDAAVKEFVPRFGERHQSLPATVPLCLTMDAEVENVPKEMNPDQVPNMDCMLRCTPRYMQSMGSCSATSVVDPPISLFNVGATGGLSVRGSAASWGRDAQQLTLDARRDKELLCLEYHSRSLDSPENTSCPKQYTKAMEEHDCQSRNERNRAEEENEKVIGKSSVTLRRGRTSASHNQSERKRRDRINQRLKTLQKLVPNSSKTDKASMLDEVIEYLKQLQAQINLIKLYCPTLMLPFTMQPPLQMPMMNAMSLGMNMGMEMVNLSSMGNNNIARMPSVLSPAACMPPTSAAFMPPTSAAFMPPTSGAFMPPTLLDDFGVVDNLPVAAATTKLSSSTMVDPLAVVDPLTAFIGSQMLLPR